MPPAARRFQDKPPSTVTNTYTDRNQLETVTHSIVGVPPASGDLIASLTYDPGMREDLRTFGNGLVQDSDYRLDNLKESISVSGKADLSFAYGYDANKNVTHETTTGTLMAGYSYSATYDDADRLKTWTRTNSVDAQSWNLDLVGNWDDVTRNGVTDVRTHTDAHEIATTTNPAASIDHDAKGNLTMDPNGQAYVWDVDNHLSGSADASSAILASYEYDALGRRVAKRLTSAGTPATVYFSLAKSPSYGFTPGQVIAEYAAGAPAATPLRTFVYGTYIDEVLAKIETGATLYYHTNRKYDVAGLTDATGAIVELYAYTPYGTRTVLDASGTDIGLTAQNNPYGFTGRRYDEETGIWYFRARYFDSKLGRFISRDPIGYRDGMSLYAAYFGQKFALDPFGLVFAGIVPVLAPIIPELFPIPFPGHIPNPFDITPPLKPGRPYPGCIIRSAGYGQDCKKDVFSCGVERCFGAKPRNAPFSCCLAPVSSTICAYLNSSVNEDAMNEKIGPILGIPWNKCLLNCLNKCMYKHWKNKDTPAFIDAVGVCEGSSQCQDDCCRANVRGEQNGLTLCVPNCVKSCGLPDELIASIRASEDERIRLAQKGCCDGDFSGVPGVLPF